MTDVAVTQSRTDAQQLCDELAALDGPARQEPVDFSSLHPRIRARAQQLYAAGQLARTTHVTVPVEASEGYTVAIPDNTAAKLAEDDTRPIGQRRLNAAARARVSAALAAKVPRAPGQVIRAR